MQAETKTLSELFQLDVRYAIPLFQRPYVWNEKDQWAPLWDDVANVASHVLVEGASSKSPSHFLGAIVIEQQENFPGSPQHFLVIDGQQRLTTLQLLLAAAARAAQALECGDQGQLLRKLTLNEALLNKGDQRFKVWPTNVNRASFLAVMEPDKSPDATADDPGNQIQEAFAFFCAQIQSWVLEAGSDHQSASDAFAALRVTLGSLMKLVAIRLEEGDNAQVIFETLNGRGTPLIALDLLKNAVFLRAATEGPDSENLYSAHWEPELDLDYWRESRRAGRLFTKNGDLYLQYWLVAELGEPVPATELFDIFRSHVLQPSTCPPMAEVIPTLAHDAFVLRHFQEAHAGSPEKRFSELLELLDTTTMMPVVLLLLRSDEIPIERRANAFATLESFLVRRMLCGWTTKNYNRLAASLITEIRADLSHADEILTVRLAAETASANRWPRDDELRESLLMKDMYGQRRQDRLVMVLWRIEEYLRTADNKTEQILAAPGKLTLEHLIPQSWEANWPLDSSQVDPQQWRITHLHRLGNLTLTTGPLNSSLSNLPWHTADNSNDKRRGLTQHSLLKLNTTVAHDYPEHFDEGAVDERGEQLTEIIAKLWPGPPSAPQKNATAGPENLDGDQASTLKSAGQHSVGTVASVDQTRESIRRELKLGHSPAEVADKFEDKRSAWIIALEEEARLAGELRSVEPSAANAVRLRDESRLRWERIAARLYGDARRSEDVKRLYDQAKGSGAAKSSYTGAGRRFPAMKEAEAEHAYVAEGEESSVEPPAMQYIEPVEPKPSTSQKPGTWHERTGEPVAFGDARGAWELSAYDVLARTARQYNAYITYGELAEQVQALSHIRTRSQMRNWIGGVLGAVADRCVHEGKPPMSALCVKQDQTVGEGYRYVIDLAQKLGGKTDPETADATADKEIDLDMHAAVARLKCYEFFGAELPPDGGQPKLPPKVEERRRKDRSAARPVLVCPVTYYQLPPSGWCDDCEIFHRPASAKGPEASEGA